MSNIYFTSDWHLGHDFAAEKRGFATADLMSQAIMDSMTGILKKRDTLWVLGDIVWDEDNFHWLTQLDPRNKLYAVLGNHDKFATARYLEHFAWVTGAVKYKGMWLTHIPIHPKEMFRANVNVHGHIHSFGGTHNLGFPYINVNWDFWKRPVSLNEIRQMKVDEKVKYDFHNDPIAPDREPELTYPPGDNDDD